MNLTFLFFLFSVAAMSAWSQVAVVRPASEFHIPFRTDGNSPSVWIDGKLMFFTSDGKPVSAKGESQFQLGPAQPVSLDVQDRFPMWIESIWRDENGILYGWYHHEPGGVCTRETLTAPAIGAVISYDDGATFIDLGLILTSGDAPDCTSRNGFFAGGHGDFSVILDQTGEYFYFFFTNYAGPGQGIAAARLPFHFRDYPSGNVQKYFNGSWEEPGLGGRVTPVFAAKVNWQRADTDSYWGPAVHWNTHLNKFVMLLNRVCCAPGWPENGIFVSFSEDLSDIANWARPEMILVKVPFGPGYYPQAVGLDPGNTDSVVGRTARLYIMGKSRWEIEFLNYEEFDLNEDPPEPDFPDDPAEPAPPDLP